MARLLIAVSFALSLLPLIAAAAEKPDRYDLRIDADISYVDASGLPSWTEGFVGKLRYDDKTDGLVISRAFVDYSMRFTDTIKAKVALEIYNDDLGAVADFTEAYLEWRVLPQSANRYRLKFGAFYPRISLENTGASWSSPYTLNSSAINTWVAEELRTFGVELAASRRPERFGGTHTFSVQGSVFWNNDPAGSLLAWKGWSLHDRQSRFRDRLPLPPLPVLEPDEMFEKQDPYVTPFREIDDRVGYYLNGEWRFANFFLLRAMHYDNGGEPTADKNGQYAWATKFDHIGVQMTLPADIVLIFQWMRGATDMGDVIDGAHELDVDYNSNFVLLSRSFGKHRISARIDHFEISDNDETFEDDNQEKGNAWTVSYQFAYSERMTMAVEWLQIKTHRSAWKYYDIDTDATERQLQLTLKLRFGN